jgi:hypothetical protein
VSFSEGEPLLQHTHRVLKCNRSAANTLALNSFLVVLAARRQAASNRIVVQVYASVRLLLALQQSIECEERVASAAIDMQLI